MVWAFWQDELGGLCVLDGGYASACYLPYQLCQEDSNLLYHYTYQMYGVLVVAYGCYVYVFC